MSAAYSRETTSHAVRDRPLPGVAACAGTRRSPHALIRRARPSRSTDNGFVPLPP